MHQNTICYQFNRKNNPIYSYFKTIIPSKLRFLKPTAILELESQYNDDLGYEASEKNELEMMAFKSPVHEKKFPNTDF